MASPWFYRKLSKKQVYDLETFKLEAANFKNSQIKVFKSNRKKEAVAVVYFEFDPNNIGQKEWQKLGFSIKQIRVINNYVSKGGKFYKKEEGASIALNFNADSFDATFLKEDKFQFHNSFPARTPDEFNYFLLQLLDTLKLDTEQTEWILSGVEQNAWLERLSKYSNTQKKADKTAFIRVSDTFSSLAPEQYYLLTALSLCE